MGRSPCCAKEGLKRGAWTAIEDRILTEYIKVHGEGKWRNLPKNAGLKRCGKSCRLRWLNYLKPDIKRGNISPEEEELIIRLHKLLGNRWSLIAGRLPGRTDNEIKNYWNTILGKKVKDDHHQIRFPCTINDGSSNHDHHQPNLKSSEEVAPKKDQSPQVIRTTAFKPTKVFVNTSQPFNLDHDQQEQHDKSMEDYNNGNNNMLFGCGETDYMMDFCMEQLCFSDFLDSEFLTCSNDHITSLSASSDGHPPSIINDEILQDWTNLGDCLGPNVDGNNSHCFNLEGDWFV